MFHSNTKPLTILIIVALLFTIQEGFAGGRLETRTVPNAGNPNGKAYPSSQHFNVDIKIREQVAITTITQVFSNVQGPCAASYGFALPAAATVTQFRWKVGSEWFTATMKASDTAVAAGGGGATMTTFASTLGSNPFVFPLKDSIPNGAEVTMELTYMELLTYSGSTVSYILAPYFPPGPSLLVVNSLKLDIQSNHSLSGFNATPTLETSVSNSKEILVDQKNVALAKALSFSYRIEFDNLTMNVLSCKPAGEDGYAVMLAVPKSDISSEDLLGKRFTFVIDKSGSMGGAKIQQALSAAEYCIGGLNAYDEFNIVRFDDLVTAWSPVHQPVTPQTKIAATNYVRETVVGGGTNIMSALSYALSQMKVGPKVNVIVFLTDGQAPVNQDELVTLNTTQTRIYVFGIGSDVNAALLSEIASRSRGTVNIVKNVTSSAQAVAALYNSIRYPLIANPKLGFAPAVVYDMHPLQMQDVYAGEQVRILGRYSKPGDCDVSISGTDKIGPVTYAYKAHLTDDSTVNTFVPKLWGRFRIDELAKLMETVAKNSTTWKEWRDEVIRLGIKFSLVTPFTTYKDESNQTGGGTGGGTTGGGDTTGNGGGGSATSVITEEEPLNKFATVSPNPVSNEATISIDLASIGQQDILIQIVDVEGRVVRTFFANTNGELVAKIVWNCSNDSGKRVAAGMYFVRVMAGGYQSVVPVSVVY